MKTRALSILLTCLPALLVGCATDTGASSGGASPGAEAAGLSIAECQALCATWNNNETSACRADSPGSTECDDEQAKRAAACASIVQGDCTDDVQVLFKTPPPPACSFSQAMGSVCDGNTRVGTCANGRRVRADCNDAACPSSSPNAMGCRIENGQAKCACGCDPDMPAKCVGLSLKRCSYGEIEYYTCSSAACREAGYGPLTGCGTNDKGLESCLCEVL